MQQVQKQRKTVRRMATASEYEEAETRRYLARARHARRIAMRVSSRSNAVLAEVDEVLTNVPNGR